MTTETAIPEVNILRKARDDFPPDMEMGDFLNYFRCTDLLEGNLSLLMQIPNDDPSRPELCESSVAIIAETTPPSDITVEILAMKWEEVYRAIFESENYEWYLYPRLRNTVRSWQRTVYKRGITIGDIDPLVWLNIMLRRIPERLSSVLPIPSWPPSPELEGIGSDELRTSLEKYHKGSRLSRPDMRRILKFPPPAWATRSLGRSRMEVGPWIYTEN